MQESNATAARSNYSTDSIDPTDEDEYRYRAALRRSPTDVKLLYALGHFHSERGDASETLRIFRQALSYDATNRGSRSRDAAAEGACDSGEALVYKCLLDTQPDTLVPRYWRATPAEEAGTEWLVTPHLRFSATGQCPDAGIPFSEAMLAHEPAVWVNDPVTSMISPFALGPVLASTVSRLRPGERLPGGVSPQWLRLMSEIGLVYKTDELEARRALWLNALRRARIQLESGYAQVDAPLHAFTLGALRAYYRRFIQLKRAHYGDDQCPRRWVIHNELVARFIHHQLTHIVHAVTGVPVKPSYVYFGSYVAGAKLPLHTDRGQSELALSMLVDYSPEPEHTTPWPLKLMTKDGMVAIHQRLGDILIYRGREVPHMRDELPAGHTSTHLFLFYVDQTFTGSVA